MKEIVGEVEKAKDKHKKETEGGNNSILHIKEFQRNTIKD
jgi:hypothetical protein